MAHDTTHDRTLLVTGDSLRHDHVEHMPRIKRVLERSLQRFDPEYDVTEETLQEDLEDLGYV